MATDSGFEAAIPVRHDPRDTIFKWRMGGHHLAKALPHALTEEQVAEFRRLRRLQVRTLGMRADFNQRITNPLRVAGKLHRRGICQIFTLPTDCRFDQIAKKGTRVADQH